MLGSESRSRNSGQVGRYLLRTVHSIQYHGLRFRTTGYRQIIEVHLLFPRLTSVSEAHRLAIILEERLPSELGMPAEVTTHLESLEDHADAHREQHYTGKPE